MDERTGAGAEPRTDEECGHCVIITTAPSDESARRIARALIDKSLAGCVQRLPIVSTYTWQGETAEEGEVLLLVKTRRDRYEEVERAIREGHGYEVPEILMLPVLGGLPAYLGWLDEAVGWNGASS